MTDSKSLDLGREVVIGMGSRVVMALLGFGGIVVFANVLGDVGIGEYRTVLAAGFVLSQLPAGVGRAIRKRASEVDVDPGPYLGTGLVVHFAFTILVAAGYFVLRPFIVPYFGSERLAFGLVLVVFSSGLFAITNELYAGVGHPGAASWADAVRSVLTLCFQLAFVWLGYQAFGVVAGLALATAASGVLSAVLARVPPLVPDRTAVERTVEFARWSVPKQFIERLLGNVDVLILRLFVGAGPVGVYTVAMTATMPGSMFAGSISNALMVKSSEVSSAGGQVREDLVNGVAYTGIITIPLFFGALALPTEILVTLFSADFQGGELALIGLAFGSIFGTYSGSLESVVEGTDRPRTAFRTKVGQTVLFVPLALVLGYTHGLLGVVAATILRNLFVFSAFQFVAHREFGGVVLARPMGDQLVAGTGMFLVVEALTRTVLPVTSWLVLFVVVSTGAAVFFALLTAISPHFRETAVNLCPVDLPW